MDFRPPPPIHQSTKAARDDTEASEQGCLLIKPELQKGQRAPVCQPPVQSHVSLESARTEGRSWVWHQGRRHRTPSRRCPLSLTGLCEETRKETKYKLVQIGDMFLVQSLATQGLQDTLLRLRHMMSHGEGLVLGHVAPRHHPCTPGRSASHRSQHGQARGLPAALGPPDRLMPGAPPGHPSFLHLGAI